MSEYRVQSPDTSVAAERLMLDQFGALTPAQRISTVWDLNQAVESRARAAIRGRYPTATERELDLRLAARKYGRDLMLRVFDWDPELQGW